VEIVELLRNIDLPTLRSFAGETIISAIEAVAPARFEREVCEILRLKFGSDILEERDIRIAILDGLKREQAEDFCRKLGLAFRESPWPELQSYFRTWNEKKSRSFVTYFDLSNEFVHKQIPDTRSAKELVEADRGQVANLKGFLHPYQKRVKDSVAENLSFRGFRGVVQMPTGAGKTLTALEAAVDLFRSPRQTGFVVWLVDSNELAEQAFEAFAELWRLKGDRPLALYRLFKNFSSEFENEKTGMVFTSFGKLHPALSRPEHFLRRSVWHLVKTTQLLIVDEAHTSVARTYEVCIRAFINTDSSAVIGLTATPGRSIPMETSDLTRLYTGTLINVTNDSGARVLDPIGYLQEKRYLAKLHVQTLETHAQAQGDEAKVCSTLAKNPARNKLIVEQIKLAADARQSTLVFAATLDHVFALQILCSAYEIGVRVITGATPQASRIDILQEFRERKFFILINLDLLSMGIDLPNVEKIIITRPVGSPILYSQILGRALRGPLNGGRQENTILTLRDNIANFPSANLVYNYFSEDWNTPPQRE
jgi:DNA repair protein RadD